MAKTNHRLAIVEDQTIFRELLSEVLQHSLPVTIVAQHESASDWLEHHRPGSVDMLILDALLPDKSGIDVLAHVRQQEPGLRVMMVTAHPRLPMIRQCLELGAHAFVAKSAPLSELRQAVERVLHGGRYYCSQTSELLSLVVQQPEVTTPLTKRQREILEQVARGMSSKQISEQLGVSLKTVENHRLQLRQKLGLHDVAGLTRYAIEQGLVEGKG